MKELDISVLLQKAEELKALFILGQRVIPFLEEIFLFVKDIKPLIDEINTSISENLKKVPNASKQLSKVTEANEEAATEIMDIVDGLVYKADIISKNLKNIEQNHSIVKTEDADFNKLMIQNNDLLQSIRDDSNSIMISLQVQDITSQQIAAVNNLLGTIQSKLGSILSKFQNSELSNLISEKEEYSEKSQVSHLHREIAFDPDAIDSISEKLTRQDAVDEVFRSHADLANSETASPDDIEALFSAAQSVPKPLSVIIPEPAKETVQSGDIDNRDEQFSQDDIDALFGK